MWCIFSMAGNKTEVMRRKDDFMRYFRMNVASMTGSEYDQVVVNSIVYTPHLIINATLDWSGERGKRIVETMLSLAKHNETLLDLSGIHYNVTDFYTAETLLAPKPIGPYMVGTGIGFKSADKANKDGDVSINTRGGVDAKEIEMMIYTGVGMIIAFLLTASLFFAICQCVHKRTTNTLINNERIERKENRLSHHHELISNAENNDCRNSFDLAEYDGRMKNSLMTNDERNDTLRRPPNLIYSQDFSQSLNSCDPRMVYTPMTDNSNMEEDDRSEEASFIRNHILPQEGKEAVSRPLSYGQLQSNENCMYSSQNSISSRPVFSPSSSVSTKYHVRSVPHRRSLGNPLSPHSETNSMVLPRSHSRDELDPAIVSRIRDINILEELRKNGQNYRTLQHPPNLRPSFHPEQGRGVIHNNFHTLQQHQFKSPLPKTGNLTNSTQTQQLRHTCQSRRPSQPKRPNSVASTPIGRNYTTLNSVSQRKSDPRRTTFRNHPVPNRYEYMNPSTGHFSDGADLLTDTDTSVDGGGTGGEGYWQMQKPLMLSTFRPISSASSSRISPNPTNSDLPASSVSSNSQQPSPNYNFSPESLIPSSFVIPPPPSHNTGMITSPDGPISPSTSRLMVIQSSQPSSPNKLPEHHQIQQGLVQISQEEIQRDVQVVFENMGIQDKQETISSRPESRTVTFLEPPSTAE